MVYLGDYVKGATVYIPFTTRAASTGASVGITTAGTLKAYINGSTTEVTAGLTLTTNFDGITGRHLVTVDTSGVSYTAGSDVDIALDGSTIDGQTVNQWIAKFSIERSAATVPANVTKINGVTIIGNGTSTKFGV